MKELRLGEIKRQYNEADMYIDTVEMMLPNNNNRKIYLSYIRNKINLLEENNCILNIQINIYNKIKDIIKHVDEWLASFDYEKIIDELPSMIDNYRSGDFNQMVLDAIKQKEAPKPDNPEPSNPSSSQANSGAENNVVPEIINKYEDELKEKLSKFGIDTSNLNNLINTLKNKDEKLVDDCITSFKQSLFSLVDTLIKDEYNINIDEEFAKNICNQLNIDCTDKEISDFVKEVTNIIDHGSIELSTVLKTGIDKMLDAFIRFIRNESSTQSQSKEEPKEKEQVEKNAKEETKEESPEKEDAIIPVPINKDTLGILSNILNLDNKGFKDIFDTLGDTQQELLKVLIALKNGNTKGKKPFKMLMSDYNELVTLNNNLVSTKAETNKKEQAVQQSNEVKTTATATA